MGSVTEQPSAPKKQWSRPLVLPLASLILITTGNVRGSPATLAAQPLPPKYADWPHWLGPERNGTSPEKGMLREWPEGGPKLLWRSANALAGYGVPSVSEGEVFVLGGSKGICGICCLNAFTGKLVWEFKYECRKDKAAAKKIQPSWGYCPRSTATVTDKFVYSIDELGELFCLDRKTGKEVWFRDLDTDYGPCHYDWKGWCASPLLQDNVLFFCVNAPSWKNSEEARFIGIDATTGKTLWMHKEPPGKSRWGGGDLWHTAAIKSFGGRKCFVTLANSRLIALHARDGECVWKEEGAHSQGFVASPQIIQDRFLLITPFDKNLDKARLYEVDFAAAPFKTRLVWDNPDLICPFSTAIYQADCIYGFFGPAVGAHGSVARPVLACVDFKTGKRLWETEPMAAGESLSAVDGLLILHVRDEVWLVEPSRERLVIKGKIKLETKDHFCGWIIPVIAYGRLYVRTATEILCYQAAETLPSQEEVERTQEALLPVGGKR